MSTGLSRLAAMVVGGSLSAPTPLVEAVQRLGFVQYDPIRRPARAQDLILHQRVAGYRCGDLGRAYEHLPLEEDHLYAYGVLPRPLAGLLHPRPDRRQPDTSHLPDTPPHAPDTARHTPYVPDGLEAEVLAAVNEQGPAHPRDVAKHFERARTVNAWGGYSAATTHALERLHYHGLLRVVRRDNGVKVYACAAPRPEPLEPEQRRRALTLHVARILAPIQLPVLRATLTHLRYASGGLPGWSATVDKLHRGGELIEQTIDGQRYVWPAGAPQTTVDDLPRRVRFLAPFDPVVWDRRRFEHLWGWPYRLEAYTPAPKRQYGYYALPMFWGERAVGWVNVERVGGSLDVRADFAGRKYTGRDFRRSFDREVSRLAAMLGQ